jgi:hypothetical protein
MSLPGVNINFLNGQLGASGVPNTDSVFAVIGACTNGVPNEVTPIVDSSTIPTLLGYGSAAEITAQILSQASTTVYVVPGTKTAGSIGTVSQSRAGAPTLVVTSLLGLPGTPFAANFANTGTGQIFFDSTNTPVLSSTAASGSVTITTAGALGVAEATVVIGSTTVTNVILTATPISTAGVILDAVLPLGGTFALGDSFTTVATPNDNANALVSILNVNSQGQAQWTYSLDGGVTVSDPISANLGASTATGTTTPTLTIAGTAPSISAHVDIDCAQGGTAYGLAAQCNPSTGILTPGSGNTGTLVVEVTAVGSSGSEVFTTPQTITLTVTTAGAAGTAAGSFFFNSVAQAGNPQTLSGTAFDPSTGSLGILVKATTGSAVIGDTYTIVVQPQASFNVSLNGAPVGSNPQFLASTGVVTVATLSGPTFTLAHTNADIYTFSATNPSACSDYDIYLYPAYPYQPVERNGQKFGINLAFGWGLYQAGDTFAFKVNGPSIGSTDVLNALTVARSTKGVSWSLVGIDSNPASFSAAATIASDVNAALDSDAQSPTWVFHSGLVCGPATPSSGSGSNSGTTTAAFIAATGALALDRVAMGCGADYITSILTGQQDLRNHGVADLARLAADPVQQDPGAVSDGALANVVSTTTPLADATIFNANRGMVATTYNGLVGTFEAEGLTLAGTGSDYFSIENRRVIDKAATYGRAALLPYVNTTVNTVPGKGTLTTSAAAAINANVQGQIQANCTGNFQSVTVAASTTANVLSTGIEPVTITVLPFGYIRTINASIGFTI